MENNEDFQEYKVVYQGGEGEIVEKKSRFIATIQPVTTQEEAIEFIERIKKQYWDARHNCSAYIIGRKGEVTRCSDDGEPSQTAGKPMLEVLLGEELKNVCVVVTRYFGGTLLGTGGLVRAYSMAVKEGLKNCGIGIMHYGINLSIRIDYTYMGKVQYSMAHHTITIEETIFTELVELKVVIPFELLKTIQEEVTESTNGTAKFEIGESSYSLTKLY